MSQKENETDIEGHLSDNLRAIFGVAKVSFDEPGGAKEQDAIFVSVSSCVPSYIRPGEARFRVEGDAILFANADKLPLGFFAKKIEQAPNDLTKRFTFMDMESNTRVFRNIVQRSFSFIYFLSGQYDPETGNITSVTFSTETT